MKVVAILSVMFTLASCAPLDDSENAKIVSYENKPYIKEENGYKFLYETSDGQSRQEQGQLGGPDKILTIMGSYKYIDTNGEPYQVSYVADDKGFRVISIGKATFTGYAAALPIGAIESLVG
ncbi:larval cuticle protein 65Ag1-like [Ctenocephalides felis]|uniref:larval cuticle protein 65Ag1-like n=1 Tax=Ctenocephalides felis TaxID=7515 RepID=UPI000E6E32FC|nr:larval cuticle protein 65Ag1-like [Ctenocephalides felis]